MAAVALGRVSLHVWDTLKLSLALALTNLGQHLNDMVSYHYSDEHVLILAVDKRVIMISIPEGRVLYQYEHPSDEIKSVFAFCTSDGNPGLWIGTQDNQLLCLDSELRLVSSFRLFEPAISLALNQTIGCIAVGMRTHIMIKSISGVGDDITFPAHLNGVKQVGWHHSLLLSLGHLDTTISLWSIQAGKGMPRLIASLNCNQPINYFSNKQGIVIAGCGDGTLAVFDIALMGEIQVVGEGGVSGSREALILDPIQITFVRGPESSQLGKVFRIPILTANLARTDTGLSITTTRGSALKPEFEIIPVPSEDAIMHRAFNEEQLLFSKSSVKNSNRHTATVIWEREVDFVRGNNLLYDRIQGEDMICDDIPVQTTPEEVQSDESIQREGLGASILIEQALKSGDKEVLDQALSIKPHLIIPTIKSIPASSAFPLLQALVARFLKCKQGRIPVLAPWYHNLLIMHGDTLGTDLRKYKSMVSPLADLMDEYMKGMDSVGEALVSVEKTLQRIGKTQCIENATPVIVFNDEL